MYGLYLLMKEYEDQFFKAVNEAMNKNPDFDLDPHPISEWSKERGHNQKSREVYCPNCKYIVVTDLPGPKCSQCYSWMITR